MHTEPNRASIETEAFQNGESQHVVMTTRQAASYLQISPKKLELDRHKGTGPPYAKMGRLVRYRKVDLDEYLADSIRVSTLEVRG